MMSSEDGLCYLLSLVLFCSWLPSPVDAELTDIQRVGLYTGCAVGGGVLLIVVIVLLVVCCRSSKKDRELKKKKKGDYQQFTEPSTLQSLYHTSKSSTEIPKTNGYVHDKQTTSNGKPVTGNPVTGNPITGNPATANVVSPNPKGIERSRSDAYEQRRHIVPEWKRQQNRRDDSNVNVRHSADDSVPTGIWTSNPTLTQGLYPSYVNVTSSGNVRGQQGHGYGSAPALHALSASLDNSVWERPRSTKINQPSRRDLDNVQEDTKELLPGSSSEDTSSERDQQTIARAYSNAAYQKDRELTPSKASELTLNRASPSSKTSSKASAPTKYTSPTKTPGQDGPFVAKVYSDYQQPKDFLPRPKTEQEAGKVARVFSSYGSDSTINRNSTPDSYTSSRGGHSGSSVTAGVHVARATVSQSSSLDSTGEPKYAKPQDALNKMTHSDWILYSKKDGRPVARSQSSKEKTKKYFVPLESNAKKAQRSSSHVVGTYGAVVNGNASVQVASRSSTELRGPYPNRHGKGVYMRNPSDSRIQAGDRPRPVSMDSGKVSKDRDNKNKKKRNSSAEDKHRKPSKMDARAKNNHNLILDIKAANNETRAGQVAPVVPASVQQVPRVHAVTPARPQSLTIPEAIEVQSNHSNDVVSPIPELSSADEDDPVIRQPPSHPSPAVLVDEVTAEEDPHAIYAAPTKAKSRPNSMLVDIPPESPLSPKPPPVPPITKLRDESFTPASRPSSVSSRRHKQGDGDGISTGKNVIGDAFRFLEDFDDNMSIDADDRL